jgi:hypothetical protein
LGNLFSIQKNNENIIYQRPKSKRVQTSSGGVGRELSRYYSGKIDSGWRDKWMRTMKTFDGERR